MPKTAPSRAWCYTINNYSESDLERLIQLTTLDKVLRHVCSIEKGENETPHLQGYIRFDNSCKLSWWKNQFPRAHVENREGTETHAANYIINVEEYNKAHPEKKPKKQGEVQIDKGVNCDERKKYASKHEEVEEVIAEIERGEKYGQIRNRHKAFCFWHRRNVIDYIHDHNMLQSDPDWSGIAYTQGNYGDTS